jgi:hypothetical protein
MIDKNDKGSEKVSISLEILHDHCNLMMLSQFPILFSENDIDALFATIVATSNDKNELLKRIISTLQERTKDEMLKSELAFWNLFMTFQTLKESCNDKDDSNSEITNKDEATSVYHLITRHPITNRLNTLKLWLEESSRNLNWPDEFELADTRFVPIPQESYTVDSTIMLDPDTLHRGTQLNWQDIEYESSICESIFYLARQGRLEDAALLAKKIGQPWRSAIILGGMYSHDPKAIGLEGEPVGNFDRSSWKRTVNSQCDFVNDPMERAVYGVLCGRLDAVHYPLYDHF